MRAKFKCPGRLETPLWLLATEAFQSCWCKLNSTQKHALWPTILTEMRAAMLSSKNMFVLGTEWAEEVDCRWYTFMRFEIIPNLEGFRAAGDDGRTAELVELLIEVARITRFASETSREEGECDFKFPSGVGPLPVAVKEKFCFAAYELTIELALQGSKQALLRLSELAQKHLNAFITDRRVLGARFPLSRLRILELSLLLGACLRIPGCDHLRDLAGLVVDVEGNPQNILASCRRILKRLNGFEESSFSLEDAPKEPLKRTMVPLPSRSQSPIVLPAESRPLSPASKRSFSEAIIQNFRSMELFDSGE
jgi:hypothetical protein